MKWLALSLPLALSLTAGLADDRTGKRPEGQHMQFEEIVRQAGLDARHPQAAALDKVSALLRERDLEGLWLVVPPKLSIDEDFDVPVLLFDAYDTAVRGRRYLGESGVIVATRVDGRETRAALIEEPKPQADESTPVEAGPLPATHVLQRMNIALRERLDTLPWRAGSYIVDVLFDQQASNRARFEIGAGAAAAHDPAVAAFIAQQKPSSEMPKDLRPAPEPGAALPSYRKSDGSLPLPAELGINIAAERVSVYKAGNHSVLRGSYRLPVPAASYRSGSGDGVAATAAVPITLVITGNLMTGPFVAPLRVASYERVDRSAAESVVSGYFELDLFALPETSKVPQTYTIWAYSGAVRSAPATAAVVTPAMLR